MSAGLNVGDRIKLAKLLALLGSDHAGERDAAGSLRNGCSNQGALAATLAGLEGGEAVPRPDEPAGNGKPSDAQRTARALRLWKPGEEMPGTPGAAYVAARGVPHLADSPALRFLADYPHPSAGRLVAMLALVVDVAGEPLALHRTYLRRDGSGEVEVDPPKATIGPIWRGAIRLDPIAPEIVIG